MRTDLLVIGLGYVGLPLAREACLAGLRVVGFDSSAAVVANLNSGRSHVDTVCDSDVAEMVAAGFRAAGRPDGTGQPETIVICVPTPLSPDGIPDLEAVRAAAGLAGRILSPGTLVVLESTSYPGTTDDVVRPVLEQASGLNAGADFSLAFSPERIDPGNPVYGLRNTPKVVGGYTAACAGSAMQFYGKLCDQVVQARSTREAEMAKLLENTYRHINIALVNEMAAFSRELGVDLQDAIRCAATKPFGFHAFYPGPGVGGHCIPIDLRFVELAQEINQRMPAYVADRAAEVLNQQAKPLNGANVVLLGVTYKKDIADVRESPVPGVARRLLARGATVAFHDPYVTEWSVDGTPVRRVADLDGEIGAADLVILLQDHAAYDLDLIARQSRLVLDTRGCLAGSCVVAL